MKEEFYKKLPNCVRQIVLKGDCDIDTQTIYVHEMSHALINRHKGNIINLLNNEAFSIFMEKVAALDLEPSGEFLDFKILKRILQIKRCLLEKELLECKKDDFEKLIREEAYILSALNATALFDTYLKGKAKLRKEIDNALGDVISGDEILENVFDYYEATPEKGAKIMQKQIKKYGKKIQYKETSKA